MLDALSAPSSTRLSTLNRLAAVLGGLATILFVVGQLLPGETMVGPLLRIGAVLLFALVVCPLVLIAYFSAMLSGNRPTQTAPTAMHEEMPKLRPDDGKALLIVARQGFIGKALGAEVRLDGRTIAQIKAPQFTGCTIEPGAHVLELGLSGAAKARNDPARKEFSVSAGETLIFTASMYTGSTNSRFEVRRLPADDQARALLHGMPMILPDG